jgi:hypothetical protein
VLDEYRFDQAQEQLQAQELPGDWDIQQWHLASEEIFNQSPRFVLQADLANDREFRESRVGMMMPLHWLSLWPQILRERGVMLSLGWLSMPVNQFERFEAPWQLKYLLRFPFSNEGLLQRMSCSFQFAQNVGATQTDWVIEHQLNVALAGPVSAVTRVAYNDWETPKWRSPFYGLYYLAEF